MAVTVENGEDGAAEAWRPLPRPDPPINRLVNALLARRSPHVLRLPDLDPYFERSIDGLRALGADESTLATVKAHYGAHWTVSGDPVPPGPWCGEVLWPTGASGEMAPKTILYPDSPWGRLPDGWFYETATQTGLDHMVSHLARWFAGTDYSEEAACTDQLRLMVIRRRPAAVLSIGLGIWRHKRVPLAEIWRTMRDARSRPLAEITP